MKDKKWIIGFVVVLAAGLMVLWGIMPKKVPINNYIKTVQFLNKDEMTSMKQVVFSGETNNTLYYNYGPDFFDFDRNLSLAKHDLNIEKIVSANISKNGKYKALSYMDKNNMPHTVLLDNT
ncbi:hypothetical protein ACFL1W_01765, partial [Candidatus Margulisiibacteriota bacterium]